MSFTKKINVNDGSGREFEDITTSEVVYDATPQLGSFNPVTSDGVAKAISGASGEVPVVNPGDAGKVLTAGFDGDTPTVSWEESQGAEYTAGNGIAINDSGVIRVNHDATLADKAPTRTLEPSYTQHAVVDKGYWYALEYDLTGVDATDTVTFKFGGQYGIDSSGSITMSICDSDPSLYPEDYGAIRLIMAKPTGASPVGQTEVAFGTSNVGEGSLAYSGVSLPTEVTGPVSSLFNLGQRTLDDFRDENGKVLVYLGVYNSDDAEWNEASSCHGPIGPIGIGRCAVVQLGYSKNYEVDWDTMDYRNVNGALDVPDGAALLSVANPVPASTSDDNGKVLKVSNGQASWQPDSMPYYDYMSIGKLLGVTGDPDKQESQLSWVNLPSPTISTSDVMSGDGSVGDPVVLNYDSSNSFKTSPMWGNALDTGLSISATGGITIPTEDAISLFNGVPVRVYLFSAFNPQSYHWYIDDPSVTYSKGITRVVISKDGSDYVFVMQAVQGINPAITLGTDGTYKGLFGNNYLYWTGAVNSMHSQGTAEYAISLLNEGGTAVLDWVATATVSDVPVTGLTYACNYVAGAVMYSSYSKFAGRKLELRGKSVPVPDAYSIGKILTVADSNGGIGWQSTPFTTSVATGTVSIDRNNIVVTSSVDVTSIVVGGDVTSAVVQWTVASTTTLPTVTDSNNVALKASVNNPASLTVGRTVQVSILNGTWVCAEFA